ncbi:MAG TPA: HD domain-containing phosphohydrolase [Gemmatimonadales bacterium]|nr:HD domain-containing phosphohydrolase [Gemmatimonadales bacterium]
MLTVMVPDRILVVDDEPKARRAVETHLTRGGYEVLTATAADEALDLLARQKIACMVAEARVFGTLGGELLSRSLSKDPHLAVIVLSSLPDVTDAVRYLQYGAMDYLPKPLDLSHVEAAVQRALRRRSELIRERGAGRLLKDEVVRLGAELARERAKVEGLTVATLEALVCVVEARDPWFVGHSLRVAQLAASIAAELGRSDEEVEAVRKAGLLHDIGMISVPEGLLAKEGSLTPAEFDEVKRHVLVGSQILAPLPHLGHVSAFVRGHHERWDGQGYPDGLAADAIPWGARMIGAAEVYDAFTTARPYREQLTPELAVERMHALTGTVLAPEVHRALGAVVERGGALVFVDEARGKEPGLEGPPVRAAS